MVVSDFVHILKKSDEIIDHNALDFKSIIDKHPYFQSARALYLKTLKKQDSFKYNFELKKTAAYTADRTVLFDFITSKEFSSKNTPIAEEKKEIQVSINENLEDTEFVTSEILVENNTINIAKKELEIGKPLNFTSNETHSFNQWLQLSSKKPIQRKLTPQKTKEEKIIDNFITNNPKITPLNKSSSSFKPTEPIIKSSELMTETLAKIYLEQKKYDSAIKAYNILSLKYPEKSGFFADQIKRIQTIQNNK